MLAERSALFLEQIAEKQRAATNVHDTTHTIRLFLDIIGAEPLAAIGSEAMNLWLDALAHYPPSATKLQVYKDLSPRDVVALAKRTKFRRSACEPAKSISIACASSLIGPSNGAIWTGAHVLTFML
jgi:hypothetical protein